MVGGRIVFLDNGTVAAPMQVNEYDGKASHVVAVLPAK